MAKKKKKICQHCGNSYTCGDALHMLMCRGGRSPCNICGETGMPHNCPTCGRECCEFCFGDHCLNEE